MRIRARLRGLGGAALLALVTLVHPGCAEVLGLQDRPVDDSGALCDPGATEQCTYSGPTGTNGVGACRAAERVCNAAGTAWGPCQGEITPKPEACDTAADDDCDGEANEPDAGCACIPDQAETCYSGPERTAGVGICKGGMRTCNPDGLAFGPCVGEVLPAVEDCAFKGDEDCSGQPCSDTLWSSIHGDEADQQPRDVAVDKFGNIFVVGGFTGSLVFGDATLISAKNDIFLVKLSPDGQPIWAKRFGNADYQQPAGIAIDDEGNVLITGLFKVSIDLGGGQIADDGSGGADAFVAKLDPDGKHLWSKALLTDNYISVYDISAAPSGDVLLTGGFTGTASFNGADLTSAASSDAYVAKLSGADGTAVWAKSFGEAGSQVGLQVRSDVSGNVVVAGSFGGSITFDLATYVAAVGEVRTFVTRLDPTGAPYFSMEIKGDVVFPSLAVSPSGDLVLAAAFSGTIDFGANPLVAKGPFDIFLTKTSPAGTTTVLRQIGGSSLTNAGEADEFLALVAADGKGDLSLVTRAKGTMDFGGEMLGADGVTNLFVGRVNSKGAHLWSKAFGPVDEPGRCFMDVALDGSTALACSMNVRAINLGTGTLSGAGGNDVLIAKMAP